MRKVRKRWFDSVSKQSQKVKPVLEIAKLLMEVVIIAMKPSCLKSMAQVIIWLVALALQDKSWIYDYLV